MVIVFVAALALGRRPWSGSVTAPAERGTAVAEPEPVAASATTRPISTGATTTGTTTAPATGTGRARSLHMFGQWRAAGATPLRGAVPPASLPRAVAQRARRGGGHARSIATSCEASLIALLRPLSAPSVDSTVTTAVPACAATSVVPPREAGSVTVMT